MLVSATELTTCAVCAGNQCQGAWPHTYLDRVSCRGVVFESQEPYTATDNDRCPSITRYNSGVVGWSYAPLNERGLSQALTHAPVTISVYASGSYFQYYTGGVFNCFSGSAQNDHAITLVAYSNSVRMSNGQTWKVWTAKNQWGTGWGMGGYVMMRKDCGSPGSLFMHQYAALPIRG